MKKDWQAMAQARGLEIPAGEWGRIGPALDALEEVFRPLAARLPPELEPALVFRAGEADE
jgi:hypothetical protein